MRMQPLLAGLVRDPISSPGLQEFRCPTLQ
jgi:hypothetical protein